MEMNQHQQPQSFYGVGWVCNLHEVHANEMWMTKSGGKTPAPYYEPSPVREHKRNKEIECKAPPRPLWWNDKEMKRKRRVAIYKLYAAQGKLKSSLKKGFHNFKITCKKIVADL